jgi:soluble lytic murein transglycosylase-like protein
MPGAQAPRRADITVHYRGLSMRNFVYAGYGPSSDDIPIGSSAQLERRRPSLFWRLVWLLFLTVTLAAIVVLGGVVTLLLKPELRPKLEKQAAILMQQATGWSADKVAKKRKEYLALIISHLPAQAGKVKVSNLHSAASAPKLTLSQRLSSAISKHSEAAPEKLASLTALVVTQSKEAGLDPLLIAAMVTVESGFNPERRSQDGKLGLLQLEADKGEYLARLGGMEWKSAPALLDPSYNLELGLGYIKFLSKIFEGNTRYLLLAKSMGAKEFLQSAKTGGTAPAEASQYAEKVMSLHELWQAELKE